MKKDHIDDDFTGMLDEATVTKTQVVSGLKDFFKQSAKDKPLVRDQFHNLSAGVQRLADAYRANDEDALERARERLRAAAQALAKKDRTVFGDRISMAKQLVTQFKAPVSPLN